jgi:Rieske Fe-S protein
MDLPDNWPRRTVIAGAGAALAAAGLTSACSGYDRPAAPSSTPTAPVDLGPTADIPVGGGKVFTDQVIVVTQPAAGEFKAFSAQCTHAGCVVIEVKDGTINCPCHGSEFHIADGTVARGPAQVALTAEQITVTNGTITLI